MFLTLGKFRLASVVFRPQWRSLRSAPRPPAACAPAWWLTFVLSGVWCWPHWRVLRLQRAARSGQRDDQAPGLGAAYCATARSGTQAWGDLSTPRPRSRRSQASRTSALRRSSSAVGNAALLRRDCERRRDRVRAGHQEVRRQGRGEQRHVQTFRAGHCFGLIGPNGAGKTTTLSMTVRLPPRGRTDESGSLGSPPTSPPPSRARWAAAAGRDAPSELRGRRLGQAPGEAGGPPFAQLKKRRNPREGRPPSTPGTRSTEALSHGMAKRVSMAQALMGIRRCMVLDEPTAGLTQERRANAPAHSRRRAAHRGSSPATTSGAGRPLRRTAHARPRNLVNAEPGRAHLAGRRVPRADCPGQRPAAGRPRDPRVHRRPADLRRASSPFSSTASRSRPKR